MFNMLDLLFVGAIVLTALALFVFVYIRENAITQKLKIYERAIEQIYQLANKNNKQSEQTTNGAEFNEAASLIIDRFKTLLNENAIFKESILQRISELENNNRHSTQMPSISSHNTSYEAKIIQLFESGFDAESIADQLRISIGEVELALNLNGFKRQ